jgi:hypothetical protein
LISEHRENVSESPVSVPKQRGLKDRSHRDRIDRHAAVVAEALGDPAGNEIAKRKKDNCHQKGAKNNYRPALLHKPSFACF